jgi:recombinational DNA repair ATPase RecF
LEVEVSEKKKPLVILEFQAKAVKALKAVTIRPGNKSVVKLTGKNRVGKSSVLDSIWYALGGKSCIPSRPIRDGATEAEIMLDLGEFTITRRITGNGEYLQVQTKDGFKAPKPQEFLSSRLGNRAQNPLRFITLKPDEQVKALQSMVKIEVDPARFEEITGLPVKGVNMTTDPVGILDSAWRHIYEQRTDINKEVKRLEGSVKSLAGQIPPGSEDVQPVSAAELVKERNALVAVKDTNDRQRAALDASMSELTALEAQAESIHNEVLELQAKIAKLQEQRHEVVAKHQDLDGALAGQRLTIEQLVDPDFTNIDARISGADEVNRVAGLIKQRVSAMNELSATVTKANELSDRLINLKTYKHQLIQAAGLPVEGLGFQDGEVTYNNFPLTQASGREQIEISCAICAAENPQIGILTVDVGWSELDKEGQETLVNFAKEHGLQIWITKVTEEAEAEGFHIISGNLAAIDGVPIASPGNGDELPADILDPANIIDPTQQPELEKPTWMSN